MVKTKYSFKNDNFKSQKSQPEERMVSRRAESCDSYSEGKWKGAGWEKLGEAVESLSLPWLVFVRKIRPRLTAGSCHPFIHSYV